MSGSTGVATQIPESVDVGRKVAATTAILKGKAAEIQNLSDLIDGKKSTTEAINKHNKIEKIIHGAGKPVDD